MTAEELRQWRLSMGMTQVEFSQWLIPKISPTWVSLLELGKKPIPEWMPLNKVRKKPRTGEKNGKGTIRKPSGTGK